jgi:hypothetical protein
MSNRFRFTFDGASWLVGWSCAALYFGAAPWWIVAVAFLGLFIPGIPIIRKRFEP